MADDAPKIPRDIDCLDTGSFFGTSSTPERVGPYRILEPLGEGGMGVVYLAEQTQPIRRRVALKLIKLGMDTKEVVARFEAERQALALMDHQNVARVLDAGATDHGRPYFVMEYVKGESITTYCDKHRLTTKERLTLFTQVCEGVQHAHQKAIIHRDLKPSNVLVTIQDDRPVPKIIDFGVAKATEHRLTEHSVFTELGVLMGTPEYMSPEQAEMTSLDIDTRTDVYSLGVMLYELLVGALPFDSKELRAAGLAEIQRRVREVEPPKPSTRVSTLGPDSAASARQRKTDVRSLKRLLRGDLDRITMKALEKDRTRRYGSPVELASDLRRHLAHEPVSASPPGTTYRVGKFVRRHKAGVSFATLALIGLIGFAAREHIQSKRISDQRNRANQEATNARQVSDFLTDLLGDIEPARLGRILVADLRRQVNEARKDEGASDAQIAKTLESLEAILQQVNETDIALRVIDEEIFGQASEKIEERFRGQPLIEAQLRDTMGRTYRRLGLLEAAEPHALLALEIRTRELGPEHPDVLRSVNELANLYSNQGRYDEAEPLFVESLAAQRRVLGEDHPDTLGSMGNLGSLYYYQGRDDEAETFYRETLERQKRVIGRAAPETLVTMANLASLYFNQNRDHESEALYLEAVAGQKKVLGSDHPDTLLSMGNLASLYIDQGRLDDAEPLFLETLQAQEAVLGEHHPDLAWTLWGLARLRAAQGDIQGAEPLFTRSLSLDREVLGEDHPEFAYSQACRDAIVGRRKEAIASLRRAVSLGYSDAAWMAEDDDLAPLRGDPDFEAILASIEMPRE